VDDVDEARRGDLWYRTPASQTDATHFEDLFLDVILQSRSQDSLQPGTVTLVGARDPGRRPPDRRAGSA
jgi:hypothetical protein